MKTDRTRPFLQNSVLSYSKNTEEKETFLNYEQFAKIFLGFFFDFGDRFVIQIKKFYFKFSIQIIGVIAPSGFS